MDSLKRSIAKSIAWRIMGFVILGSLSYIFTGSWTESLGITLSFNAIRLVLYVIHERIWNRIGWGRETNPDPLPVG